MGCIALTLTALDSLSLGKEGQGRRIRTPKKKDKKESKNVSFLSAAQADKPISLVLQWEKGLALLKGQLKQGQWAMYLSLEIIQPNSSAPP